MRASITLTMLLANACAAESDDGTFVGKWGVVTGNVTVTCGSQMDTGAEVGFVEFAAGTDSDLVQLNDGTPPCEVKYSVVANVATVVPGQQCSGTTSSGATVVAFFEMSTYTLADNVLTLAAAGTSTVTPAGGGTPVNCSYSINAKYRRVAN